MPTTSTVPDVFDAILQAVNVELAGVTAFESWPGPAAAPEMVVFGEIEWAAYDLASIKSGRQHRNEEWAVTFEVFVFGVETTPDDPKVARDRAFVLAAALEDVLADNPKLGIDAGGWVRTALTAAGPRVFEKAWAYRVAGRIHCNIRLT